MHGEFNMTRINELQEKQKRLFNFMPYEHKNQKRGNMLH